MPPGPSPRPQAQTVDDRYRPLFDLSPQPAWVYDARSLRFLEVNEAAVHSYGWTRDEFLGMSLRDIRPPVEIPALEQVLAAPPDRERHAFASVHRTKAGLVRRVEISSYPLQFDGVDARMVLVHDMSDRVAAEEALVRSEQNYRMLVEQLQDVFFRTDADGRWSFLNPAWTTLTGHPVEESLGAHYLTAVHPADRALLLDELRPLTAAAVEHSMVEVRFFRRDGGHRWVEASTRAIRSDDGHFLGTTGTLRDVTARRVATEERERLATDIRQLLDASGDGIVGLDARGTITFINRRGAELLGYEGRELVGRSMHEATHYSHPDGRSFPAADCPMERAAKAGIPCEVADDVLWRRDGIALRVEYTAAPVRERALRSGAVVNFRDISARKRAELELIVARDAAEAASRAKSDFLARMSHELRTPLNSIIGFANVLLKNKHSAFGANDLSFLGRIATNGRHLLGLINDILDLSKIEAGHMSLEIVPVQLDALVRDTLHELDRPMRDPRVELRAELPDRSLPIAGDEARMRQVLVNLVGNALKFTERGEVVVRLVVDAAGSPVRLDVSDTGIGIPAGRLDAIFNVFEQAESMINRRFGGTGLGLAISRSLCELMGHRLDVSSVEGTGTTMSIALGHGAHPTRRRTPVSVRAIPAPSPILAPDCQGQTVLVVDDEQDARILLAELLEEANCRVVIAATGVEALRLAREVRPGMIFLDLRLPRISGFDVLRILQADDDLRDTPVVVVSVVGSDSRNALAGTAAILDKPLDREAVFATLRRLLPDAAR